MLQAYVYGVVPPRTITVASPSQTLLQEILVLSEISKVTPAGSERVTDTESTHPIVSVMVSV